jgi:hypothetical protein
MRFAGAAERIGFVGKASGSALEMGMTSQSLAKQTREVERSPRDPFCMRLEGTAVKNITLSCEKQREDETNQNLDFLLEGA